jgi:hypothetical protein
MKVDITDPKTISKVYENLSKKAKQRLTLSAICGREAFYDQLNVECILIAVGIEADDYDQADDGDDYY